MTEAMGKESLWREVLLIAFGFALATAGQWFWQYQAERKDLKSAAVGLREVVKSEVASCEKIKTLLANAAAGNFPQNDRIYPKGFDISHDASLYLEIRPKCFRMKSAIVHALVRYDVALKQAQFLRDINREALEMTDGDVRNKETSAWQGYVITLDFLIKKGTNLINELDKKYQPQSTP